MTENFIHWTAHMDGLENMMRLRGGIQAISSNVLLRLIIFWYVFVIACLSHREICCLAFFMSKA
jgi:hypothetical protein